jgi:hypothetical protein
MLQRATQESNSGEGSSIRKRTVRIVVGLLLLVVGTEVALRGMWKFAFGLSFTRPDYFTLFYPEISRAEYAPIRPNPDAYNVLFLGGSVLQGGVHSQIDVRLRETLARRTGQKVRIYNLASVGHSTLDSFYKYQRLSHQQFDLVIVYHGINEVRANNCPAEIFRDDYSHYAWYELINELHRRRPKSYFVTPYSLRFLTLHGKHHFQKHKYIPRHHPPPAWLDYGAELKTPGPFEANLRKIVELANAKREPVLLMTFAYHLVDGYTDEAFQNRQLDYSDPFAPVGLWGKPDNVRRAVDEHNRRIIKVAQESKCFFVDQRSLMPPEGEFFNDVCHLTHEGTRQFVANMLDTATAALRPETTPQEQQTSPAESGPYDRRPILGN